MNVLLIRFIFLEVIHMYENMIGTGGYNMEYFANVHYNQHFIRDKTLSVSST